MAGNLPLDLEARRRSRWDAFCCHIHAVWMRLELLEHESQQKLMFNGPKSISIGAARVGQRLQAGCGKPDGGIIWARWSWRLDGECS